MAANTSKTTHTRTGVSDDGLEAACRDRYCPAVAEVPSLIPVMVTHPVARCALCAPSQCLGYDFVVDIHGLHRFIFSCSASVDMGDHSIVVFVMPAPPSVRRGLRPPRRRVLPFLLTSERRQVEQVEIDPKPVRAARGREIGTVHGLAVAEEDAEPERFPVAAVTPKS